MNAAVQNLEQTVKGQTFGKGARLAAAAALAQTGSEALAALQRLDPIIQNLLRDDKPTLAVWESARRVERGSRPAAVEEVEDPPPNTTTTNSPAATASPA